VDIEKVTRLVENLPNYNVNVFFNCLQLLAGPRLTKVELTEAYLSELEFEQLLALLREKRILMQRVETLEWKNSFEVDKVQEWMFSRVQLQLLLDTIQVSFPSINLLTDEAIISHCFPLDKNID